MGDSISEGTIAAVLKQPGESVAEDETIMQIETDKVTIDVKAPKAGKLENILVAADDNVTPGQHVATVAEGEEGQAASSDSRESGRSQAQEEMGAQQSQQLQGAMSQPDSPHPGPQGGGAKQAQRQEKLETESKPDEGVPQASVSGSGRGPGHRQPSIKFPIRRTADGQRLSAMPFEEAEAYRRQAASQEGASVQPGEEPAPQPQTSTARPKDTREDEGYKQRHMLWYRGTERGSKLSQSSVLSQREMDMIELGGAGDL